MGIESNTMEAFKSALRNGFGLTRACQGARTSPKDMTKYLNAHPEEKSDCENIILGTYNVLIQSGNELLAAQKIMQWRANNEAINNIINRLNLWEEVSSASHATDQHIITAYRMGKTIDEAATLVGMAPIELDNYLYSNPVLRAILKIN